MSDHAPGETLTFVCVDHDGTPFAAIPVEDNDGNIYSGQAWHGAACWAYVAWREHEKGTATIAADVEALFR
jgi:hypothetical protein